MSNVYTWTGKSKSSRPFLSVKNLPEKISPGPKNLKNLKVKPSLSPKEHKKKCLEI